MTTSKAFWGTCVLSLLLFLVTCWSAAFGTVTPYWVESFGYFILTYLCIDGFSKKIAGLNPWSIGAAAIIGQLIIQVPIRVMDFYGTLGSLMIVVSCVLAILLAVVCYKEKRPILFVLAYVIMTLFNSVVADIWNNYTNSFIN